MMNNQITAQSLPKESRLELVDALRGFALLGIIIANVPGAHSVDLNEIYKGKEYLLGSPETDRVLQMMVSFFIDKKFITIFSILFGFGFSVQLNKVTGNSVSFNRYFAKRMFLLLVIGCVHAYLLWFGDITRDYAICGLLLLLIYQWPLKRIFWTAILFSVPFTAIVFILNSVLGLQQYSYDYSLAKEVFTTDSYGRYLSINATIDPFVNFVQDSPLTLVFCFGNILLGYWLGQIGFFSNPMLFRSMRNKWILLGSTFGIGSSIGFWAITTGQLELNVSSIWLLFFIVAGMVLQSLFYIALFVTLFQNIRWRKIFSFFIPVGRMALTNYLMQTVFCLLVFYNWPPGFQLYGKLNITETYLVAALIYLLQVIYSHWWLQHFSQGPVEKLWRKLAYQHVKTKKLVYINK